MTSIAEKYAAQWLPNGEVSLDDLIQAAVDESKSVPVVGEPVGYNLSQDYKKLFEFLTQGNDAAGFVTTDDYMNGDVVGITRRGPYQIHIGVRGYSHASIYPFNAEDGSEEDVFITACEFSRLKWIAPAHSIPAALTEQAAEHDRKQALLLEAHCERVSSLQERIRQLEALMVPGGFPSDVMTAAGLVYHGKRDKALAERLRIGAQSMLAAYSAPAPVILASRCPMCFYQHGHQIGCENNPVDIALRASAPAPKEDTSHD